MFAFRTHSRRLRPAVWAMLFVWLFALAAGVTNACVLSGPSAGTPQQEPASPAAHSSHKAAGHHDGSSAAQHHEPEENNAKDGCLKFCDDESSALSKGNISATDPGVSLMAAVDWPGAVVPTTNVGTRLSLVRPTAHGPPLVIRLLRLTL